MIEILIRLKFSSKCHGCFKSTTATFHTVNTMSVSRQRLLDLLKV